MPYFVAFLSVALTGYAKRQNCLAAINDAYGNSAIAVRTPHMPRKPSIAKRFLHLRICAIAS